MENKLKVAIHTVILNELDEYLKAWLDHHSPMVDQIFIFEDIDSHSHKHITDQYPNVTLLSVFDIGYGKSTTVNELIDILKELINPSFDNVIYQNKKPYDVITTLANTDKLYKWFGFKPKYDIKKGLYKWQIQ